MPEVTENYIRIPNPLHTESGCGTLRTVDISTKEKIKALYCVEHKKVKTFLFDKDAWTRDQAKEWVKERTKMAKEERKFISAEIEEVEGKKLFIASTDSEDRDGDVLSIDGWDLKNFKKNPVLLWAHNNSEPPVATAKSIGIKTINGKKVLAFEPEFHDVTERAREIKKLVDMGVVRTTSVGYLPKEREGNVTTRMELLEVSFVPVPANPEALSLAFSKGISDETIKEVLEINEKDLFGVIKGLVSDMSEIKKQVGDVAEGMKYLKPEHQHQGSEGSDNTGRDPQQAKIKSAVKTAQLVDKAVEQLIVSLKGLKD